MEVRTRTQINLAVDYCTFYCTDLHLEESLSVVNIFLSSI